VAKCSCPKKLDSSTFVETLAIEKGALLFISFIITGKKFPNTPEKWN